MHSQNFQHRDIKPANILLRPGRFLITDFGISRDRRLSAETTTELHAGGTLGYMPPEVRDGDKNNPAQTDIYSLGCVFLRIMSVIHGPNQQLSMILEKPHPHQDRFRERQFKEFIAVKGRSSQHQILPLEYQNLIANMLEDDRHVRPNIETVNSQLRVWSTSEEKYHGPCCWAQLQEQKPSIPTIRTAIHESDPPPGEDLALALELSLLADTSISEGPRMPIHHLTTDPSARPTSRQSSRGTSLRPVESSEASNSTRPSLSRDRPRPTQLRPVEKKWFRILNTVDGVTKALQITSNQFLTVAEPKQGQKRELWQFAKFTSSETGVVMAYMYNLALGNNERVHSIDLGGVPSLRAPKTYELHEYDDAEALVYCYRQATDQEVSKNWPKTQNAIIYCGYTSTHATEHKFPEIVLAHDGETAVRSKLRDVPPNRFWYLEEASMKYSLETHGIAPAKRTQEDPSKREKSEQKDRSAGGKRGWHYLKKVFNAV